MGYGEHEAPELHSRAERPVADDLQTLIPFAEDLPRTVRDVRVLDDRVFVEREERDFGNLGHVTVDVLVVVLHAEGRIVLGAARGEDVGTADVVSVHMLDVGHHFGHVCELRRVGVRP